MRFAISVGIDPLIPSEAKFSWVTRLLEIDTPAQLPIFFSVAVPVPHVLRGVPSAILLLVASEAQ